VDRLAHYERSRAGNVTVKSVMRSHASVWEEKRRALHAYRNGVDVYDPGRGEQLGQRFDVAGTGVRNGIDYLAVDGRYMGGESTDSTNMTISLPVQSTTIPRTQVSKTTVTVLP
jgi:hypothetical protein